MTKILAIVTLATSLASPSPSVDTAKSLMEPARPKVTHTHKEQYKKGSVCVLQCIIDTSQGFWDRNSDECSLDKA